MNVGQLALYPPQPKRWLLVCTSVGLCHYVPVDADIDYWFEAIEANTGETLTAACGRRIDMDAVTAKVQDVCNRCLTAVTDGAA